MPLRIALPASSFIDAGNECMLHCAQDGVEVGNALSGRGTREVPAHPAYVEVPGSVFIVDSSRHPRIVQLGKLGLELEVPSLR